MTEAIGGQCREPGCTASSGGACIEDLTPQDCPNFTIGDPPEEHQQEEPSSPIEDEEQIPVRGGQSLSPQEVDAFLRETAGRIRTVALIGDPEVGKTTLMASLYEMVRAHRLSVGFAGSSTLRGFEERCHLSRTISGRSVAATQRTRTLNPLSFLHLRLVRGSDEPCHLILGDRAGEDYERLLGRPDEVLEFGEIARFGVVGVLVDGERLVNPTLRNGQIARARRFWLALESAGLLQPPRQFQLILTKADRLGDDEDGQLAQQLFDELGRELSQRFPEVEIAKYVVAARPPKSGGVPFGLGLEELVLSWLRPLPARGYDSPVRHRPADNMFDGMTVRLLPRSA